MEAGEVEQDPALAWEGASAPGGCGGGRIRCNGAEGQWPRSEKASRRRELQQDLD